MDPFSIVVGSVALTETATKLASVLADTYQAYRHAPTEMLTISSDITFCAGLVEIFAKSVDGSGQKFPKKFQQDAERLVDQCDTIMRGIEKMIPSKPKDPDSSNYKRDLKYAFRKKAIEEQQERLKKVQHMFMFMSTCWMYQLPAMESQQKFNDVSTSASGIPTGTLKGLFEHVPIQISMGEGAQSVAYEATLTLNPARRQYQANQPQSGISRTRKSSVQPSQMKPYEAESLANMRRSPYFSLDLLRPAAGSHSRAKLKEDHIADSSERLRLRLEMRKEKEELTQPIAEKEGNTARIQMASAQQAKRDVKNLMRDWFDDDLGEDGSPPRPPSPKQAFVSQEASIPFNTVPNEGVQPNVIIVDRDKATPTSSYRTPSPAHRWNCDGCKLKCTSRDRQWNCRECDNFDFCDECYGLKRHWHPFSSFKLL